MKVPVVAVEVVRSISCLEGKLFRRMDALMDAYAPVMLDQYRFQNLLVQPWLKGFKQNIFDQNWA